MGTTACIEGACAIASLSVAGVSERVLAQGAGPSGAKNATVMIGTGIIVLVVVFWFAAKTLRGKSKPAKGRVASGSTRLR